MAIAYGGEAHSAISSSASTRTTGSCTIPANALVWAVMKWEDAARTPTMSGGGVGTWNYLTTQNNGSYIRCAYGISSGATGTLTASYGSATNYVELQISWYTGIDTSSPFESQAGNTGTSTTASAGPITNTSADALYLLGVVNYAAVNYSAWGPSGSGGVEVYDGDSSGHGYYIAASSASRSMQATCGSSNWAATLAVFAAAAAGGTTYNQSVSGGLTPAGALVKQVRRALAGALTPAGAALRQTARALAGSVSPAGTLLKQTARSLAGSLAPSGVVAGARTVLLSLAGSLAPAGALVKQTARGLAGTLDPAGTLVRQTAKALAGALTPSGAVAGVKTALVFLSGAIAPAGALVRQTGKAVAGSLTPAGTVAKRTARALAGALSPAGGLAKRVGKALSGVLGLAGSVLTALTGGGSSPGGGTTTAGSGVARTVARGGTTTAAGGVATTERSSGIAGTEA